MVSGDGDGGNSFGDVRGEDDDHANEEEIEMLSFVPKCEIVVSL